jgi:hypothetical protein
MAYRQINMELIVFADDEEAVVKELNAALDQVEERHTIFGGGIESAAVEHRGTRKRTALMHTRAAGEKAAGAVRAAGERVVVALKEII